LLNQTDDHRLITPNIWHYIKITLDSAGATHLYVDGATLGTSNIAPYHDRSDLWTLHIGDFDGDIDEVRISNAIRAQTGACP
jgi:hypothetical protein